MMPVALIRAASFGAVLNASIQRRAPDAVHLVNQLLDPLSRADLAPQERDRLIALVAGGLHGAFWLALGLSTLTLLLVALLPPKSSPAQQTLR
jgi:hypothetical protein